MRTSPGNTPKSSGSASASSRARAGIALLRAAEANDASGVMDALGAGADVNVRDARQFTPLMCAIVGTPDDSRDLAALERQMKSAGNYFKVTPVVQMLLKAGAQVNVTDSKGRTPLFAAVGNGNTALCQELIRRKANVNYRNPGDGTTAIFIAVVTHNPAIVDLLLSAGAVPKSQFIKAPLPLLSLAILNPRKKQEDDSLGEQMGQIAGAILGGKDTEEDATFAIVDRLLRAGADPNEPGKGGVTPLMVAGGLGSPRQVRLLLGKGAKANATATDGSTALFAAASESHVDNARILLEAGCPAGTVNRDGYTALWIAAEKGSYALVQMLLHAGVPRDARNRDGQSARDIAVAKHNTAIVRLLDAPG